MDLAHEGLNSRSYCRRRDNDNPTRTCRKFLYMNSLCRCRKQQEFDVQIRSSTSSYYKMRPVCCSFFHKKRSCDNSHVYLALLWLGRYSRYSTALVPCLVFLNAKSGAFSAISPREAHSMNYEARAYRYRRLCIDFLYQTIVFRFLGFRLRPRSAGIRRLTGKLEKKSKAAQTKPKKLIRRTCPSGHGSDGSGPKWHAPPCSESAAQKKSFRSHEAGLGHTPSFVPPFTMPEEMVMLMNNSSWAPPCLLLTWLWYSPIYVT